MRVMVLVKANPDSEAGKLPSSEALAEMGAFNEELNRAGVLLAADGLKSSAEGKRVRFGGSSPVVLDGPFAETKELVAGYWIWEVASMDEAVQWLKRAPFPEGEVELRRVFEAADFADVAPAGVLESETAVREQAAARDDG